MKPNQSKMKLQLKKYVVSNLANAALNSMKGGEQEAYTTSRKACTGFLCCEPPTTTITDISNIVCPSIL